jgi:hypothetical protein
MPVHGALKVQSNSQHAFWIATIFLLAFLVTALDALAGTLVNPTLVMKRNEITSAFERGAVLNTGRADLGVVPQRIWDATLGAGAVRWPTSRILEEVGKQAIDQPGHFLIGAAPILAYREWLQWPSRRWWDPPLDWAFLALGAVAATCGRRGGHGFAVAFAAFGRRMASGLALRGRLPQRA